MTNNTNMFLNETRTSYWKQYISQRYSVRHNYRRAWCVLYKKDDITNVVMSIFVYSRHTIKVGSVLTLSPVYRPDTVPYMDIHGSILLNNTLPAKLQRNTSHISKTPAKHQDCA